MAALNVCPRQQCRGRAGHGTLRHWTPVYLGEVVYVVEMHAKRRCWCGKPLLVDLARLTWDTIAYFAREGRRKLRYFALDRGWIRVRRG